MTIIYQNRALRAVRNCDMVMPTSFKGRPGFVLAGELHGKKRTFYVVEDQLFLVRDNGKQYHLGAVQENAFARLSAIRTTYLLKVDPMKLWNEAADQMINEALREQGFAIPEMPTEEEGEEQ